MTRTVKLPDGWDGVGTSFSHESGGRVIRDKNPATGITEWRASWRRRGSPGEPVRRGDDPVTRLRSHTRREDDR